MATLKTLGFSRVPKLMVCFWLFSFSTSFSQQKILQFKHLTPDDGLSSSLVISMVQDYKGFVWFGTYDGLNRYDGTKIIIYKYNPLDSGSINENHIQAIYEDRQKNLYIGTRDGLARYDRNLDRFINYKLDPLSPFHDLAISINGISGDSMGNLWLSTGVGLILFNRQTNTIKQFRHDPNDSGSVSWDAMDYTYFDSKGRLWVATKKGLNLLNTQTGKFQHITRCATHNHDISGGYFLQIIEDREGNIWFGGDGVFCLERNNDKAVIKLTHYLNDPKDPNSLSINRSRSLFVDDDGKVWVGTENGGLNIFNKEKKNFYRFRKDDFNPMSMNNESIHVIMQDRQKNIWIGTYGGGVNVVTNNSSFLVHYKNLPGAPQSLGCNIVSSFVQDRFGRIWVGTDGGGINLFNDATGRFTRFTSENTSLQSNGLNYMYMGFDDKIWIGSWEGGLANFDCITNKIEILNKKNSSIPDITFYSIAQDSCGDLWLGSFLHGLVHYQIKQSKFVEYSIRNSAIGTNEPTVVRMDRHGRVYVGGTNCFQAFSPKDKQFSENNILSVSSGRGANAVFDIFIENDTCTWVATQNGLCQYNQENKKYRWYGKQDGLPSNTIKGVLVDRSGILWLTTNNGLCRYDRTNNKTRNFAKSDGLQSNEFYRESMLLTKSGTILAGGNNGFNVISPDNYSENRSVPQVVLTDFHLFNDKLEIGAKGSPLRKQISETNKMTLAYNQSVLTFYFAVMDFTNPDKNQYAYMMENFDKEWIYCGNRKEATYTNLDPGAYRFHVKGSNNDKIWNEIGTTMELVITPPWWETKTARAVFVVLLLLLLLGIYFYFRNKQEQKHLREIVASQKKTEDIMRSIDEAIFTVNEDMSINPEHSKTAEKIFGTAEFEKQNLASIFHFDQTTAALFAKWLKLAFRQPCSPVGWEKATRFNPIKEVVLTRENRTYLSVNCQPIYEKNALSRVMIIVNDITKQKKIERYALQLTLEKTLQMERVSGLVNNDFESVESTLDLGKRYIESFEKLRFDATEESKLRLREMGRDLHTLKGSGGSMDFMTLSKRCNELEGALQIYIDTKDSLNPNDREQINTAFSALQIEIKGIVELRDKLFSGKVDRLSIDKKEYAHFLKELQTGAFKSIDEVANRFSMFNALKFSEFCAEFSKMIARYDELFQKTIEPLKIETPDTRIERTVCKIVKGPVTHLIRNAVDHGIENNDTREKAGKGPGHISMALHENNGRIELEIADDGGGIDPERVAASAVKKGFITLEQAGRLTDEQKQNLIFVNGFSTKDAATTISGRGVGMNAVKTDIEKAGGDVKVVSRVGQGTQIFLRIPRITA
jgi:ligand-binding sensor domain-containing protein/HPt (histidine-containing phosphotransfer) domain-containing protein